MAGGLCERFANAKVAKRSARNEIIAAAWQVHFFAHTAEAREYNLRRLSDALETYSELES